MEEGKIVIIGASISGLSCGIRLLQKGYKNVEILERSEYGREKVCSGIITNKAYNQLKTLINEDILKDLTYNKIKKIEFIEKNKKKSVTVNPIKVIDRTELDKELINTFCIKGGKIRYGHNVIEYTESREKGKWEIHLKDAPKIICDKVILANGCQVKKQKCGKAIEIIVNGYCNAMQIILDAIQNGYAWIMPYGDKTQIGIKTFNNKIKTETIIKKLEKIQKKYNYKEIVEQKKFGYIPAELIRETEDNQLKQYKEFGYITIGDRSGIIDYVTGEGIFSSVMLGILTAEYTITPQEQIEAQFEHIKENSKKSQKMAFILNNIFIKKIILGKIFQDTEKIKYVIDCLINDGRYTYETNKYNLNSIIEDFNRYKERNLLS